MSARVKRAEIMAIARTQTNDTRCFNTHDGHGRRAKRQGAKRLRGCLKQKDRRELEDDPSPSATDQ